MVHVMCPTVEFVHIELSIYQSKGNILMSNAYIDALKKRRTQYALGRNLSLSKEELIALVRTRSSTAPRRSTRKARARWCCSAPKA